MSIKEEVLESARKTNLPAFLEGALGIVPVSSKGENRFYYSPFRAEKSASLHVSYKNGSWIWYDHGSAEKVGGDAIDLLRRMGYSFADAVKKLASFEGFHGSVRPAKKTGQEKQRRRSKVRSADLAKMEKVLFTRKVYSRLPVTSAIVEKYFLDRGLPYYEEIGARLFVDFKNSLKFIAFPIPSPLTMRGMELREVVSATMELSVEKKRKCYGVKALWVFKRSENSILVTESIMDALAGEVLFNHTDDTLIALNGVPQAHELEVMLQRSGLRPRKAFVCMDNDAPGREATAVVKRILLSRDIDVYTPVLTAKDPLRELLGKEAENGEISV